MLNSENNFETNYGYISQKSQDVVNKDEFVQFYKRDSTLATSKTLIKKIHELEIDQKYPNYKRFKVEGSIVTKTDTVGIRWYYTLINENNSWKVIWTRTLKELASRQYQKGLYSEAIKLLEKILEIDPFSSDAYSKKAWCYLRDNSLSSYEQNSKVLENAKKAIALEPDMPENYNTLAMYYSVINIPELKVENLQKAALHCLNEKEKSTYYSNLASTYLVWNKLDSACSYIDKAIALDSSGTFSWMLKGDVLRKQNLNNEALHAYERALRLPVMESGLQKYLYFDYSMLLFSRKNFHTAHQYILKALEIEPNNTLFQRLYKDIKSKIE